MGSICFATLSYAFFPWIGFDIRQARNNLHLNITKIIKQIKSFFLLLFQRAALGTNLAKAFVLMNLMRCLKKLIQNCEGENFDEKNVYKVAFSLCHKELKNEFKSKSQRTRSQYLVQELNYYKSRSKFLEDKLFISTIIHRILAKTQNKSDINLELKIQKCEILEDEVEDLQAGMRKMLVIHKKELRGLTDALERSKNELLFLKSHIKQLEAKIQRPLITCHLFAKQLKKELRSNMMNNVIKEASLRANIRNLENDIHQIYDTIAGSDKFEPVEMKNLTRLLTSQFDDIKVKTENAELPTISSSPPKQKSIPDSKRQSMQLIVRKNSVEDFKHKETSKMRRSKSFGDNLKTMKLSEYSNRKNSIYKANDGLIKRDLPLMAALVSSNRKFFAMVNTSSVEELTWCFISVFSSLSMTPMWLFSEARRVLEIIEKRSNESFFLQHALFYAVNSGFVDDMNHKLQITKDSLDIYYQLVSKKKKKNFILEIPKEIKIFSPFEDIEIKEMAIKKVFNSNARPILVKLVPKNEQKKLKINFIIVKKGDDLRRDMAVMHMFTLMNSFWSGEENAEKNGAVEAVVYKVCAFNEVIGAIEYVKKTLPIQELRKHQREFDEKTLKRQINTAAGGTIASFVLGIKDRHDDNTLFCRGGNIFQIDFSYMLGEKVTVDTADISITRDMKRHFGQKGWHEFVETCLQAFAAIRRNSCLIIEYATVVFSKIYPEARIKRHLTQTLMLYTTEKSALKNLKSMLLKAPSSYRTRFKNALHHTAQAFGKKEEDKGQVEETSHDES